MNRLCSKTSVPQEFSCQHTVTQLPLTVQSGKIIPTNNRRTEKLAAVGYRLNRASKEKTNLRRGPVITSFAELASVYTCLISPLFAWSTHGQFRSRTRRKRAYILPRAQVRSQRRLCTIMAGTLQKEILAPFLPAVVALYAMRPAIDLYRRNAHKHRSIKLNNGPPVNVLTFYTSQLRWLGCRRDCRCVTQTAIRETNCRIRWFFPVEILIVVDGIGEMFINHPKETAFKQFLRMQNILSSLREVIVKLLYL